LQVILKGVAQVELVDAGAWEREGGLCVVEIKEILSNLVFAVETITAGGVDNVAVRRLGSEEGVAAADTEET